MTEIELHVPNDWYNCPEWWRNFVETNGLWGKKFEAFDAEFKKWGVRYVDNTTEEEEGDGYCYFQDEKSLAWFMLRWACLKNAR